MKKLLLLLAIFMASNFSFAQSESDKNFESNLKPVLQSRFKGEETAFLQLFYSAVKYPAEARSSCRVGKLLVEVVISEKGEIQVRFKNHLGKGLEDAILSVLDKTSGHWLVSESPAVLRFTVAFNMDKVSGISGDLNVMAYGTAKGGSGCGENADYEELLEKAIKKGKTDKALEYAEELLRRDPFSAEYNRIYSELAPVKKDQE